MTAATKTERCQVYFLDPWYPRQCTKRATTERGGVRCCGVHARQADKWDRQGRMQSMIDHWWRER